MTHATSEAPRMPPCTHRVDDSAHNHTSTAAARESTTTSNRRQLCNTLPTTVHGDRWSPRFEVNGRATSVAIVSASNVDRNAWDVVGGGSRELWTWAAVINNGNRDSWPVRVIIGIRIRICGERDLLSLWGLGSRGSNRWHRGAWLVLRGSSGSVAQRHSRRCRLSSGALRGRLTFW